MFEPRNPNFAQKVNESFALQSAMSTLGMTLDHVGAGEVHIRLAKHDGIVQQMGFVHGGVLTTGLDSACGYAALSLAPASSEVMTVEFKTSFFAPAGHDKIIFIGKVLKPGSRANFTEGEALGIDGDHRVLLAKMSATMTYIDLP
jgi:uncharacterized protein (TIGR00369 family)